MRSGSLFWGLGGAERGRKEVRQNPGTAGSPAPRDDVTVRLPPGVLPVTQEPPDGVTVLVPGVVLAPAPTPHAAGTAESPVFVDDSGGRKRLLRLAGVLIALLSIGFLAIVGVALAVPDVATSVGLGAVVPFVVPGAAALPPQLAPLAPRTQPAQPKPQPKLAVVATPKPKPVAEGPVTTPDPTTEPAATTDPAATTAPAPPAVAPTSAPAETQVPATQAPIANPVLDTETANKLQN